MGHVHYQQHNSHRDATSLPAPSEIVFQEQSYDSLHSPVWKKYSYLHD